MEIDGHPTQDLVDELVRRGAVTLPGDSSGPDSARAAARLPKLSGFWIYVSSEVYDTEIDEGPPLIV
ncbi:MAG TPA: hypothetical protein VHJ78_10725 [Actinomycetota bacterium]|nr:hypothetical protein [Actinomycetota bacterium]